MRLLLILAHPLQDSLNARLARHALDVLRARGHDVTFRDLYAENFDPKLSAETRRAYYRTGFEDTAGLAELQGLVLVFPTWWFGMPAILKGWIDRNFLPGVAYDHDKTGGALRPKLHGLRAVMVVTTLGAPGMFDRIVMRRPVRRSLKYGLIKPCAPRARFDMASLYRAETVDNRRIARFEAQVARRLNRVFPTD